MESVVIVRGPGALGQTADVCAVLREIQGGGPESDLVPPTLDTDLLREILETERTTEGPTLSPSPVALARLAPSPIPGGSPFERQVPIYLLPDQASAQATFLVRQQTEPILAPYLRQLFQFTPQEGG